MKFSGLSFPRAMNLSIVASLLSGSQMMRLLKDYAKSSRRERRIVLPSTKCIRKAVCYYLVEKHRGDYDAVMRELKGDGGTLGAIYVTRQKVRALYESRAKEIEIENEEISSSPL